MPNKKSQFLKNRIEEYISILPLISLKSFKFPLKNDYIISIQNKLKKNENIDNIDKHIQNFEHAINRSLMSICGFGVFNFLPNKVECLVEIEDKVYSFNGQTNGFFNVKLINSDNKIVCDKKTINNGLISLNFTDNNEMFFIADNKKFFIKSDVYAGKKQQKIKIFDTYILGDSVNAIMESNSKILNIKQSISSLINDNKFSFTYILDRKCSDSFTFVLNFDKPQKLLNKHKDFCYMLYEYEGFSIITGENSIGYDNKIEYAFKKINNKNGIIRELIEFTILFNPNNSSETQKQIINQLYLKSKPLVKIISDKIIDDISLYKTSNEKIILNNIYLAENNIGIIIQIENISSEEEIAKINYANLEPKYVLNDNLDKKERCFSGVKLKSKEKMFLLMQ